MIEVVPSDPPAPEDSYLQEEEEAMDQTALDARAEAVADRSARYTEDEEIKKTFEERQDLAAGGRERLKEALEEHHAENPDLTAGDMDAAWEDASQAGDEAVGGTAATPEKNVVDRIGKALGLEYDADEPLGGEEKLRERDRNRWELDPESAEEEE